MLRTKVQSAFFILSLTAAASAQEGPVVDVPQVRAVHDYLETNPVYDALAAGVTDLEVDIYRVNGELVIGDTLANATANGFTLLEYLQTIAALESPPEMRLVIEPKNFSGQCHSDFLEMLDENNELDVFEEFLTIVWSVNDFYTRTLGPDYVEVLGNAGTTALTQAQLHMNQWGYSVATNALPATIAALDTLMTNVHTAGDEIYFINFPANQTERETAWGLLFEAGVDFIGSSPTQTNFAAMETFLANKATEVQTFLDADLGPAVSKALSLNDHQQATPLYDAMDAGFEAVEVNVFLTGGELRIGGSAGETSAGVTLDSVYLSQLDSLGDVPFTIFVEFAADANNTYVALVNALSAYEFENLSVIAYGEIPSSAFISFTSHPDYLDVELLNATTANLNTADSAVPAIRSNLSVSGWNGAFEMPVSMRRRLRSFISSVHGTDKQVRLYGVPETSPDRERVWEVLVQERADWIASSDLAALSSFLGL